jgi:hypothetical protein
MDVLAAAATTMDAEVTLAPAAAPHSPVATTIARMKADAPAEAKRAATGGRDAKLKAEKINTSILFVKLCKVYLAQKIMRNILRA